MIYNILAVGDIHFGAMDPDALFNHLFVVIEAIRANKDNIDLVVINGDYFDYLLQLNSKSAIRSLEWFALLVESSKYANVKRLRVLKGTEEHDHDQLEAFRVFEHEADPFLRIFNFNTVEETLPDLKCVYCPDENLNDKEYFDKYLDHILEIPDIGFFHGSFDLVLPDIALQIAEKNHTQNIIYYYRKWAKLIRGPMIASHWHDAYEDGALIYLGSFDRWEFGQEETKGFGIIRFDTESKKYAYTKVSNPFALEYKTYVINTSFYQSHLDYSNMAETILNYMADVPSAKIRIVVKITDDKPENDDYIKALQQRFANKSRRVKFTITNPIQKKKKLAKRLKSNTVTEKYKYIFDKGFKLEDRIQRYLLEEFDVAMDLDDIAECIGKYLPK